MPGSRANEPTLVDCDIDYDIVPAARDVEWATVSTTVETTTASQS